jgi:hypothetical protein
LLEKPSSESILKLKSFNCSSEKLRTPVQNSLPRVKMLNENLISKTFFKLLSRISNSLLVKPFSLRVSWFMNGAVSRVPCPTA